MTVLTKRSLFLWIILVAAVFAVSLQYAQGMPSDREQEDTATEQPKIVRATDEQANYIRACLLAAGRARSDAGAIGRGARDPHFETFFEYQMNSMEQKLDSFKIEHQNFTGSLTEDQKERIAVDVEAVDKIIEAVDSYLKPLHEQIKKSSLDREIIRQKGLAIEDSMKACQQYYKNISSTMRVKLERGK